jgi:hypothetical protein
VKWYRSTYVRSTYTLPPVKSWPGKNTTKHKYTDMHGRWKWSSSSNICTDEAHQKQDSSEKFHDGLWEAGRMYRPLAGGRSLAASPHACMHAYAFAWLGTQGTPLHCLAWHQWNEGRYLSPTKIEKRRTTGRSLYCALVMLFVLLH